MVGHIWNQSSVRTRQSMKRKQDKFIFYISFMNKEVQKILSGLSNDELKELLKKANAIKPRNTDHKIFIYLGISQIESEIERREKR